MLATELSWSLLLVSGTNYHITSCHVMFALPLRVFWQLSKDSSFQPFPSRLSVVPVKWHVSLSDTLYTPPPPSIQCRRSTACSIFSLEIQTSDDKQIRTKQEQETVSPWLRRNTARRVSAWWTEPCCGSAPTHLPRTDPRRRPCQSQSYETGVYWQDRAWWRSWERRCPSAGCGQCGRAAECPRGCRGVRCRSGRVSWHLFDWCCVPCDSAGLALQQRQRLQHSIYGAMLISNLQCWADFKHKAIIREQKIKNQKSVVKTNCWKLA